MITFHGDKHDAYGMPEPFYPYIVYVSETPSLGPHGAIATAVSITETEHAKHEHFPVHEGSVQAAAEKAKAALRERHKGLTEVPSAIG